MNVGGILTSLFRREAAKTTRVNVTSDITQSALSTLTPQSSSSKTAAAVANSGKKSIFRTTAPGAWVRYLTIRTVIMHAFRSPGTYAIHFSSSHFHSPSFTRYTGAVARVSSIRTLLTKAWLDGRQSFVAKEVVFIVCSIFCHKRMRLLPIKKFYSTCSWMHIPT